jgi:hypothetical protein
MSGTRRPPRGRIAKWGPIRTRSSPSDSAEGGAPKVGEKRFFAPPHKNSQPSRAQGSRRRTPGVGARRGAKRLSSPTRRGRSAGERKSENRGKTGENGVFRRRFEKTRCNTGRNDVRRTRPEATDASAQSASIGARRAKSQVRKTEGKSRKPDDSGATFGTVGGPVAVDAERRNSAVGRGDALPTRSKNFVPIGRAVRTPGTSARDHPSGETAKRPIDAGHRRTRRRRGTDARNSR